MAGDDPERARRRLETVYAAMNDGELESLAEDASSLTPEALEALRAELARRKLTITVPPDNADATEVQSRDLVTIRKFLSHPEAMIAKSELESAGIECFLIDEWTARMYVSIAVGGIRLQVNRSDAEAALEILGQRMPESAEPGSDWENDEDGFETKT